ncbi:unnamed protein product, partial [Meganyctiphanes norvegica]
LGSSILSQSSSGPRGAGSRDNIRLVGRYFTGATSFSLGVCPKRFVCASPPLVSGLAVLIPEDCPLSYIPRYVFRPLGYIFSLLIGAFWPDPCYSSHIMCGLAFDVLCSGGTSSRCSLVPSGLTRAIPHILCVALLSMCCVLVAFLTRHLFLFLWNF